LSPGKKKRKYMAKETNPVSTARTRFGGGGSGGDGEPTWFLEPSLEISSRRFLSAYLTAGDLKFEHINCWRRERRKKRKYMAKETNPVSTARTRFGGGGGDGEPTWFLEASLEISSQRFFSAYLTADDLNFEDIAGGESDEQMFVRWREEESEWNERV
jgi:hypothetical protein